jgi:hypothetical protein
MELTIGQELHKALSKQIAAMDRFPALGESRTETQLDEIFHLMTEAHDAIDAAYIALMALSKALDPEDKLD